MASTNSLKGRLRLFGGGRSSVEGGNRGVAEDGLSYRSGDADDDEDEVMDVDTEPVDDVAHAVAAAKALNEDRIGKSEGAAHSVAKGIEELNMDAYDDEDGGKRSFLLKIDDDDEDEDEVEDMTIKPTDSVIVCARNEDEFNYLEASLLCVLIFEESRDGDTNMYVHHDIILPSFPLCLAWLDCNLKSGDKGNFLAVGSMEPAIEIWDLDLIDEVQPFVVLGGVSKKKNKGKKKTIVYRKDSHRDAVLGLAWNKEVRNVLASASADKSVKIWDMVTGKCVASVDHHTDKVQTVAWNRQSPELLLSGSFDKSVVMVDAREVNKVMNKWSVMADVESLAWNPHVDYSFVVIKKNGVVQGFDIRVASSDKSSVGNHSSHSLRMTKPHQLSVIIHIGLTFWPLDQQIKWLSYGTYLTTSLHVLHQQILKPEASFPWLSLRIAQLC
ncbi:hypothetical protein HPP92_003102 [Vanilla planifolia]|uniref:Anaphase-promoting complex subunit 4-like WD40 domain-containing protein n=1 Tax=Vanilla planifolia TaxID=51239 RepID=A0A835RU89_VANPL|nr:hypothetical protein HPP92_003102 [Vanilla planifolia]